MTVVFVGDLDDRGLADDRNAPDPALLARSDLPAWLGVAREGGPAEL